MNRQNIDSQVKFLFSKYENKLGSLEGYFILVNSYIEDWLDWEKDRIKNLKRESKKELSIARDFYYKKLEAISKKAGKKDLSTLVNLILADEKARVKLKINELKDFKSLIISGHGKIPLMDQIKNAKNERKILRQFSHQSFFSLVCSLVEALLKDLAELFSQRYPKTPIDYNLKYPHSNKSIPLRKILENYLNDNCFKLEINPILENKIHELNNIRNDFIHSGGKNRKINYQYHEEVLKNVNNYISQIKKSFETNFFSNK